jgi:hypothetical protein
MLTGQPCGMPAIRVSVKCTSGFPSTLRKRPSGLVPSRKPARFVPIAVNFASSVGAAGTTGCEDRAERAARLSQVTYDDLLQDRVAYGTPDMVLARLRQLRGELGLTGIDRTWAARSLSTACSIPSDCLPRKWRRDCARAAEVALFSPAAKSGTVVRLAGTSDQTPAPRRKGDRANVIGLRATMVGRRF